MHKNISHIQISIDKITKKNKTMIERYFKTPNSQESYQEIFKKMWPSSISFSRIFFKYFCLSPLVCFSNGSLCKIWWNPPNQAKSGHSSFIQGPKWPLIAIKLTRRSGHPLGRRGRTPSSCLVALGSIVGARWGICFSFRAA